MPKTAKSTQQPRQILGISLPPEVATAVKIEAARRRMTVRALFEEMWTHYRREPKAKP